MTTELVDPYGDVSPPRGREHAERFWCRHRTNKSEDIYFYNGFNWTVYDAMISSENLLKEYQIGPRVPSASQLVNKKQELKTKLEEIVCTEGIDAGVVLKSEQGSTKYDPELKCNVYVHEYFSPLGDALIELYELIMKD